MRVLYTLGIHFYKLLIYLISPFNQKAKLWIEGRKNWEEKLKAAIPKDKPVLWFHCASLGEFEQARPVIEQVAEKGEYFILLSFFSPSGFEAKKDYTKADYICYLPLDSPGNAKKFIALSKVKLAVFIKYEFWFNFLHNLKKQVIPCILVSGIFRPSQVFFKWYGAWFSKHLKAFNKFYLQNNESVELLQKLGTFNMEQIADTRFDRVAEIANQSFSSSTIAQFKADQFTLVLGSSWEKEHEFAVMLSKDFPSIKMIIAPHEIKATQIKVLKNQFEGKAQLFSEVGSANLSSQTQVLIIDQIGLLSKLYRYGEAAIIGGGFGLGIHNSLEAACYGIPVLFGPKYQKFQEAKDLIEMQAAFCFLNYKELKILVKQLIQDTEVRRQSGQKAFNYVQERKGSSERISSSILSIASQKN